MGDIAQSFINDAVDFYFMNRRYQESRRENENKQEWHIEDMELDKAFKKQKSKFDYVTSIIGEEYLQKELREMYDELVDFYDNKE